MEIDVKEYLSEEDMKRIAEDAWREQCHAKFITDKERILSNTAYQIVYRLVDEHFNENLEQILRDKVIKIINEMSAFNVFKQKDVWGKEESVATKLMNQVVVENKDLLTSVVQKQMINARIDEDYLTDAIKEVIINKLTSKEN